MFSLFCVMTLESWPDMARTVSNRASGGDWYLVFFFVGFIFASSIFLLNVVAGVIFESVLHISQDDDYEAVVAERRRRKRRLQKLHHLFLLADTDDSDTVTRDEFN